MTSTYIHTKRNPGVLARMVRFSALLYWLCVAAAIGYLWTLTQDRFISSAVFKVSKADTSAVDSSAMMGIALAGLDIPGLHDAQTAIGFIHSSNLLIEIEKEFNLVDHYSSPQRDLVFRMNLNWPLEERLDYYRKRIAANFVLETGLTTLEVDTFDRELSQKVARSILRRTESFVNQIHQNVADQHLNYVRGEVDLACNRVDDLNRQLVELQNRHKLITPEESIVTSMTALRELEMERVRTESQVASLERDSPGSPSIESLRSRLRSLKELIEIENAKLSGPERERMNQILVEFTQLRQKLDLAIQLRTSAELMMEKTRIESAAQTRFLSVIQQPHLPEDVAVPRRWYATCTILVLSLLVFLILRALTHSMFEGS